MGITSWQHLPHGMIVSIKRDNGTEVSIQHIKVVHLQLVLNNNACTYIHIHVHIHTDIIWIIKIQQEYLFVENKFQGCPLIWHTLIGWTNKCMIIGAIFLGISGWYSKNTIIWNEKDLDLNPGWILLNVWHNLHKGCVKTKKHKIKRLHKWYLKGNTKLRLYMLKHLILAYSWNTHKKFSFCFILTFYLFRIESPNFVCIYRNQKGNDWWN